MMKDRRPSWQPNSRKPSNAPWSAGPRLDTETNNIRSWMIWIQRPSHIDQRDILTFNWSLIPPWQILGAVGPLCRKLKYIPIISITNRYVPTSQKLNCSSAGYLYVRGKWNWIHNDNIELESCQVGSVPPSHEPWAMVWFGDLVGIPNLIWTWHVAIMAIQRHCCWCWESQAWWWWKCKVEKYEVVHVIPSYGHYLPPTKRSNFGFRTAHGAFLYLVTTAKAAILR